MQKRFIKSHSLNKDVLRGTCPFSFSGPRSCKRPGAGCTPTSTKIRLTVSLWSRAYLTDKQCQLQYLQNRAYHAFVSAETTLPSSDLVGLIVEFAQQTIRLHKFRSHSFPGQMKLEPWTYIVVKIRVLSHVFTGKVTGNHQSALLEVAERSVRASKPHESAERILNCWAIWILGCLMVEDDWSSHDFAWKCLEPSTTYIKCNQAPRGLSLTPRSLRPPGSVSSSRNLSLR